MASAIEVLRASIAGPAALDMAVSRALLAEVADGERPASLRVYRPHNILAFSVSDARRPGFAAARDIAREAGFQSVIRLAGGRAAAFTRESVAFAWATPEARPRQGIEARFASMAGIVVAALRALGVDAQIGEVAGEYCPGSHSVNARGVVKLMGVGQRVVTGAAHVGGVITVGAAAETRALLEAVYRALDYPMRPETIGFVAEESQGATVEQVGAALLECFARDFELIPGTFGDAVFARARAYLPHHEVGGPGHAVSSPATPRTRKTVTETENR